MRLLLSSVALFLCLPGFASASNWCGGQCANYYCILFCSGGTCQAYCINPCPTCNGVYLAPKTQYTSPATTNQSITFNGDPTREVMASALHEVTGWAVSTPEFGGVNTYRGGTYSGTVAQIAQQIAAAVFTTVQVDEANHIITFGVLE